MNEEELKVQKQIEELEQQTENMTEEEYFRKNNPDFCYGERPLSPYWDLFQDGVEFGERQSEEKIEELKRNKKTVAHLLDCLEEKMKERIEELETQNKLLGKRCNQLLKDKGDLTDLIEKMKQCGNCGNGTIGNCEYCKRKPNQIFADTLTSDYWRLKEIKRK